MHKLIKSKGAAHRATPLADSPTSCPLSTDSKKARPLNNKMANADTLYGAGVNSGNALDAAKLQNNSETTKDLAKKNCLLSYHSALIAGASARQLKQSWHRVPSIRKINQLSCQVGSKWWIVTQAFRLQRYKENMKYRHIL